MSIPVSASWTSNRQRLAGWFHPYSYSKFYYLLILVDTFTGWIEVFLASRETANVVAHVFLDHIIPPFGIPWTMEFMLEVLNISWKFHIPFHPQSLGNVMKANGFIKQQLMKLSIELRLSWPSLLPIALTSLQVTPCSPMSLSTFELLYGRPFLLNHHLPAQTPAVVRYLPYLSLLRSLLFSNAESCFPASTPVDPNVPEPALLSLGDRVLFKQIVPRSFEPQWIGPHIVIITTPSAVRLLGYPWWYSRHKRAPTQDNWSLQQLRPSTFWFSKTQQ